MEHRPKICTKLSVTDTRKTLKFLTSSFIYRRNIEPGEVIMEEHPITVGPKQFTSPVCLGCYRPVAVQEPAEDAETTGLVTNNMRTIHYILHVVFLTLRQTVSLTQSM